MGLTYAFKMNIHILSGILQNFLQWGVKSTKSGEIARMSLGLLSLAPVAHTLRLW